jgi:hypothetical protein
MMHGSELESSPWTRMQYKEPGLRAGLLCRILALELCSIVKVGSKPSSCRSKHNLFCESRVKYPNFTCVHWEIGIPDPVIALTVHMHKDQVVSWSQYWYTQMLKAAHTVYRFTSFVTTWNQYYSQHANCFKQQASPSISGSERWSHSSLTSELAVLSVIQGIALAVTHTTFRHNHLSCKSS